MRNTPVPPGAKCSISQASEPVEKGESECIISPQDQDALEQAPFFEAFRKLLYQGALRAHARLAQVSQDDRPNEVA
ncbi:MAG TPA: hypothetical protein VKT82_00945 [Ktedonobacterales bacterium]|nr:hypothetical protein [Ktedonobacterales bacterium]